MSEQQRDFKGVWITKEVWLDTRLNALEKVILAEIDSLDGENGCFASNQYIADFCQCSLTKVSTAISKLIELGYIYTESFDGRTRILKSRLSKFERQTFKNCDADFQKVKDNNTENKTDNNIIDTTPIAPKRGEAVNEKAKDLFAKFWASYPVKVDKKGAERVFLKIKNIEDEFGAIMDALDFQKESDKWKKDGGKYIPYPKTWLSQERWKDEIETPKQGSFDVDDFYQAALARSYGKRKDD